MTEPTEPVAFLSYARFDDRHDNQWISQFHKRLEHEVEAQTGEPFSIFQDGDDILLGEQWQQRLDQALDTVTFLIPVFTPSFFKSSHCRAELERFLKREQVLGRNDLILPIYYITVPLLEDASKRAADVLVQEVHRRQWRDWRELRNKRPTSLTTRKHIIALAKEIVQRLERMQEVRPVAQPTESHPVESTTSNATSQQAVSNPPVVLPSVSQPVESQAATSQQTVSNPPVAQPTESQRVENEGATSQQVSSSGPTPHNTSGAATSQQAVNSAPKPPTLTVDQASSDTYRTIGEAIAEARPGTQILVKPGVYEEEVVIDKYIDLIGDGARDEIVLQASGKSVIKFSGPKGRLYNLTVQQTGKGHWHGVDICEGTLDVEGCAVTSEKGPCILIHHKANSHVWHNDIYGSRDSGILVRSQGHSLIEKNNIYANRYAGISIRATTNVSVRGNTITDNQGVGIHIEQEGGGTFENNDLCGNGSGAWNISNDSLSYVNRSENIEA